MELTPIAYIRTDFDGKFGLPRQSGLVPELTGEVVFTREFSRAEAVRGLEQFSHIWLLWGFSEARRPEGGWSATVRPPRLGGNTRLGVFATRSPFRPNPIGLSCVQLEAVHTVPQPVKLTVSGIDLVNGTPIYDIKPYLPYADAHPEAAEGYTAQTRQHRLSVCFPPGLLAALPEHHRDAAAALLAEDPRPGYLDDPERVYGVLYAGFDIRFRVCGDVLTVTAVEKAK
ncbi:MAG: tRNA (N6-threonylcarbamoyladenosine(37)-N6)-methyltransferase TrmO [Oscillospiraceae bacterium]|nr:tRNA (N6-threonylcarbamoyladenosine(37)-N6)-methyltransferase TrmO [Oscillospiraceae bacterium]